ncbi:MAG: DEAD/DEAH box helicase [Treponema sp.]|jgi:ATP-dependent Lhr-like helicase|nr:DEAD/DEAH box helicase [Treponema sp.]
MRDSYFSSLAPFVREYIYEKKWQTLKDIQEKAAASILDGDSHVLIAAGTAAGKTEACFFPVLSLLCREGHAAGTGAAVLCIGPLKALINDQFERLKPLAAQGGLSLWRWHGDIAEGHKQQFLENPSGILQITPESLEALLLRRPEKTAAVFRNLSFVIIDEIHAFMGTDRGSQLLCLIGRICEQAACDPRRIGLSASLGDYDSALAWIRQGTEREGVLVKEERSGDKGPRHRISLAVDYRKGREFYPAVYEQCRDVRKSIIFTNSRQEAEETVKALKEIARERGEEDHYHVHHGSISASLRTEAERRLRESEAAQTVAATATLELGIDIGKLDRIIQIGAPMGVSAFVQRLGRSGRRSGISQMYFCSREYDDNPGTELSRIPWTLLKTIAVIQLYLEEQWTENAEPKPLPYSLLCHQTLSVLASLGEHSRPELYSRVLSLPPFREISEDDYGKLLEALISGAFLETTEEGNIILGLEGERMVNHYSFYSVFPDEEEFRVTLGGRELGKVNFIPPEGSGIILGGKNWKVEHVNLRSRRITVSAGSERGARIWRGGSGSLHTKVVRRMRQALTEETVYPYLSASAAGQLGLGREASRLFSLSEKLFIPRAGSVPQDSAESGAENNSFYFIPWLGSRGMRTLTLIMQKKENRHTLGIVSLEQENHYALRISSKLALPDFQHELQCIAKNPDNPETLLESGRIPYTDKYDYLLPQDLLLKQYAANMLDPEETAALFG